MDLFRDRRILRRQAEGIPAHRVQYIEPLSATIAGNQIAHRVVADMADMQLARRIGKHFEHIVFRPAGFGGDFEQPALAPNPLPFRFGFSKIIARHHGYGSLDNAADAATGYRAAGLGGIRVRFRPLAKMGLAGPLDP